ncbi:MAG: hypothetical protein FWF78_01270 [Defluviitaleaceae bacterium]|nr:hypothetical protein [Defluviitaleaceae bacterium]
MAAITQVVEDQIKQIRKERAELDELRASLERKEAELDEREIAQTEDVGVSGDRKESLLREIDDLTATVTRLRAERDSSIEDFGGDMTKIHEEKTAESAAQVKQIQGEINFLLKGKAELEEEVERLREQLEGIEERAKAELNRVMEEKDALLARSRAEHETTLKELNHAHSISEAALLGKKKELENEIAELEQTKEIEWSKLQAEISRHKTTQLAELDSQREQFLAELEKEKINSANTLRAYERKQRAELSTEKREWEKEILKLQSEKQKVIDQIKMQEYEYEKIKSDNLIKVEKKRVDEEKAFEAGRAEALLKLEEEQNALITEHKKQNAEQKLRLRSELKKMQKEIEGYESRKTVVLGEIDALDAKFEQKRVEIDAQLEIIRIERQKEADEKHIANIQAIEEQRVERASELERAYLDKASALEVARLEKLDECHKSIVEAEQKLRAIKQIKISTELEIENLRTETMKITEENISLQKIAEMERRLEMEKIANDKIAETDKICEVKLAFATERAKKLEEDNIKAEEKLAKDLAEGTEALLELRRETTTQKLELEQQKADKLEEIEKATLEALENLSKTKLEKLAEIEEYLANYKHERLENIKSDIDRQSKANYKQVDELAAMNDDYNKRMLKLQEMTLAVEADMRLVEFKNRQISMLQSRNQEVEQLLANNTESAKTDG